MGSVLSGTGMRLVTERRDWDCDLDWHGMGSALSETGKGIGAGINQVALGCFGTAGAQPGFAGMDLQSQAGPAGLDLREYR